MGSAQALQIFKRLQRSIKWSDRSIFLFINHSLKSPGMDLVMFLATCLGSAPFAIALPLLMAYYGGNRMYAIGWIMATILIISQIIVQLLKRLVHRPRPYKVMEIRRTKYISYCQYSFPSGHSCAAMCIAVVLASTIPSLTVPVFALALLTGLSRIYLGVHYPSDVLTGFAIAFLSFALGYGFFMIG